RSERPVRRASSSRAAVAPTPSRKSSASARSSSCLPMVAQTVAHPAHGLQHARVAARLFDLAAQGLDVDVDGPVADNDLAPPDRVEKLAALEYAPGAAQEGCQQVELGARERQLGAGHGGLAAARIGGQRAHFQRLLFLG